MMYSRHSSLAQLFGDDSYGFRSGLDDDGSDMDICGGVRGVLSWGFSGWKGLIFLILFFYPPNPPNIVNVENVPRNKINTTCST
jgi:hypothetical protein